MPINNQKEKGEEGPNTSARGPCLVIKSIVCSIVAPARTRRKARASKLFLGNCGTLQRNM